MFGLLFKLASPILRMFGINPESAKRGVGFVVLNILRVLTIIALAAATASSWVLMVKVQRGETYFVFQAASLFFLGLICVFLTISEIPVNAIKSYYRDAWPNFSDEHGLTWLGLAMVLIGCNLLGQLNHPAFASDKFGLAFWQLVMASGILCLTFGALNVMGNFVWRESNGINARHVRSRGADALPKYYEPSHTSSLRNEKTRSKFMSTFWNKKEPEEATSPRYNISSPIGANRSPIMPDVTEPPAALHPAAQNRRGSFSSSRYSDAATRMSRF
jgi:hypothetical protein